MHKWEKDVATLRRECYNTFIYFLNARYIFSNTCSVLPIFYTLYFTLHHTCVLYHIVLTTIH